MQNLYEILGVTRNASNRDINAALRQLVRRYNEETLLGTCDSAEALRVVNRARITFADPNRRAQYDAQLIALEARREVEAPAPITGQQAELTPAPTQPAPAPAAPIPLPATPAAAPLPATPAAAPRTAAPAQPAPTRPRSEVTSTSAETVAKVTTTRADPPTLKTQGPPTSLGLPPLSAESLGGGLRPPSAFPELILTPGAATDTRDAIMVFDPIQIPSSLAKFETRAPLTAAAAAIAAKDYDFRSILATRDSEAKRSTAPRPLPRLAARLIDYGLWGILLTFLLKFLVSTGLVTPALAELLGNPFLAPILITFTWTGVEGILLIFFPITPGKFLLNIRVAFNVSNPYASSDPGALVASSFARAFRVWLRGVGCGLIPFCFFSMARACRKLLNFKETTWDFDGDCLVTHGKSVLVGGTVASVLLVGGGWLYFNHWAGPFQHTLTAGLREAGTAADNLKEMYKVLRGDMPSMAKPLPPAPPAKENRTVALEQEARTLLDNRRWLDLSEHCRAWTRENERNATAWFCYGRARHELKDYSGATIALKRAALLAPQNDDIRRFLQETSLAEMQQIQLRKRGGIEPPPQENSQSH